MIEVAAVTVAVIATAAFRYLTVREIVKHADKKDVAAIARAMYSPFPTSRNPQHDQDAGQRDNGGSPIT